MKLTNREIKLIKDYFKTRPVLRAYIFGSYARGEADEKSDVDILVDLDQNELMGLAFFSMYQELEQKLHKKIDIIPSDSLSPYVRESAHAEKKLFYER